MYLAVFFGNVPSYFSEMYLAIFFGNVPSYFFGNVPSYLQSQGVMTAVLGCAHSCVPDLNWQLIVNFLPHMKEEMQTLYAHSLFLSRSEMYINSSTTVQWWPTMFWYFVSAPAFNSSSTIAEWPALQTGHGWDEVDHFAQKEWIFVLSRV